MSSAMQPSMAGLASGVAPPGAKMPRGAMYHPLTEEELKGLAELAEDGPTNPVPRALARLDSFLSAHEEAIDELTNRLEPVLVSLPAVEPGPPNTSDSPPCSPLAYQLQAIADHIARQRQRIVNILNRLEV